MNKIYYLIIIPLAVAVLSTGCAKKDSILAKIDNKIITEKEFNDRIAALPAKYQDVIKQNKRKFLDEIIVDYVLYDDAIKNGMDKDKEVKAVVLEAKKKIIIAKYLKDKVDEAIKVDEAEIKEYYEKNKDDFRKPEILRASHILVPTEKDAKDALADLSSGKKFEDVAKTRSIDASAEKGGDIGYFARGQVDPDFEKVVFGMEKEGQISDIVKTRFGYHIIKLTERKAPSIATYDEVKKMIEQNILQFKKKQQFNDIVEHLKDKAKIDVNEKSKALADEDNENKEK